MCMVLMTPNLSFAGADDARLMADGTLVSAMDVKGTTGSAYWSAPETSLSKYREMSVRRSGCVRTVLSLTLQITKR